MRDLCGVDISCEQLLCRAHLTRANYKIDDVFLALLDVEVEPNEAPLEGVN